MTVYKNSRDKWCYDIEWVSPDGDVKRIRKTSPVQTRAGAEREERKTREALSNGTYGKKTGTDWLPTVLEYKDTYVEWCRGEKCKASGMEHRESLFRNHILGLFGDKRLDEFCSADQLKLRARFGKLSSSWHNGAVAVLNKMIAMGMRQYAPSKKPFQFEWLKITERKKTFYDFDECDHFTDAAASLGTTEECIALLGTDAGCRRGEIIALTVRKVDFKNRLLIIEQAEYVIRKERNLDDTKGRNSRAIPMTDRLYEALRRHVPRDASPGDRVLLNGSGQPLTPMAIRHIMRKIQKAAGLEVTGSTHIMRHTFCSHLALKGVPVMTIMELAGHSSVRTTMGYMHLAANEKRRAMDVLRAPNGIPAATDSATLTN